jgi:hypothetical protein
MACASGLPIGMAGRDRAIGANGSLSIGRSGTRHAPAMRRLSGCLRHR